MCQGNTRSATGAVPTVHAEARLVKTSWNGTGVWEPISSACGIVPNAALGVSGKADSLKLPVTLARLGLVSLALVISVRPLDVRGSETVTARGQAAKDGMSH